MATGTVKWFNATKGYALSIIRVNYSSFKNSLFCRCLLSSMFQEVFASLPKEPNNRIQRLPLRDRGDHKIEAVIPSSAVIREAQPDGQSSLA